MKKILWLLMLVTLSLSLVGCFGLTDDSGDKEPGDSKIEYEITYSKATLEKNSIGIIWISVIAEVTNTGSSDLFLGSGDFDLEDTTGTLVKSISLVSVYPQIISQGEKAYYYETTTIDGVNLDADLSVILHPSVSKSKLDKHTFPISELKLIDKEYSGIRATGRVENNGDTDESMLYIVVVLFNKENNPLAVLFTIEDVNSGVIKGFEAGNLGLSSKITSQSVSKYVSHAYPYQFQF